MKYNGNFFVKAGLFIVLCSWLAYTIYWLFKGSNWGLQASSLDLFASVVGTSGFAFRIGAVLAAIFAMVSILRGYAISRVLKFGGIALVLETIYFMTFIPSAVFGFLAAFELSDWHTLIAGGPWFIVETVVPTLVESIIMPVSLLKLRTKLTNPSSREGMVKWAYIVGMCYLIVFWLTYFTQWIATFMQPAVYASLYPGFGTEYVLNYPLNMFTFILTSVGFPLLMLFFWRSSLPAMRDPTKSLNLRKLGITLNLLGFYFIAIIAIFRIFGVVGGESIWILFFMFNNPDLWCVTLPVLGIPLILTRQMQ